jgi:hypothetical protein
MTNKSQCGDYSDHKCMITHELVYIPTNRFDPPTSLLNPDNISIPDVSSALSELVPVEELFLVFMNEPPGPAPGPDLPMTPVELANDCCCMTQT